MTCSIKKITSTFIGLVIGLIIFVPNVKAGFGVSPPYLRNDQLTRGSEYSQTIYLVRDNPNEELEASLEMNVPGAEDWIGMDRKKTFVLPVGERQSAIVFTVSVPKNADFKEYKGMITVKTKTVKAPATGVVSIALGVQVDVYFKVIDKQIIDFVVRSLKFLPTEEGRTTKLILKTENTGNVEAAPTQVHVDFYDSNDQVLLLGLDNANTLTKIKPYSTSDVSAEFSTETLKQGTYWAHIKVLSEQNKIREEKINLTVYPAGSLPREGVSVNWKLVVGVVMILIVVLGFIGASRGGRRRYR